MSPHCLLYMLLSLLQLLLLLLVVFWYNPTAHCCRCCVPHAVCDCCCMLQITATEVRFVEREGSAPSGQAAGWGAQQPQLQQASQLHCNANALLLHHDAGAACTEQNYSHVCNLLHLTASTIMGKGCKAWLCSMCKTNLSMRVPVQEGLTMR